MENCRPQAKSFPLPIVKMYWNAAMLTHDMESEATFPSQWLFWRATTKTVLLGSLKYVHSVLLQAYVTRPLPWEMEEQQDGSSLGPWRNTLSKATPLPGVTDKKETHFCFSTTVLLVLLITKILVFSQTKPVRKKVNKWAMVRKQYK